MNDKTDNKRSKLDLSIWTLVVVFISAGVVANVYYAHIAWSLRLAAWIILACIIVAMGLQTSQGRRFWEFAKEARGELRKVVWPTRQETIQNTIIVVVMVIVTALILWGVDSLLMWGVSFVTGQR